MNPLDKEELQVFQQTIKKDMPLHTFRTAKLHLTYGQRFPKNLMDYSEKLDNEFLDNNLAIIEEIQHRDPKNIIPSWFRDYHKRVYGDSDNLNKDNFFKAKIHDSFFRYNNEYYMPSNTRYRMGNTRGLYNFLTSKVNGTEFSTNAGSTGHTGFGADILWASLGTTGTLNGYYDQLAASCFDSIGNIALGCYLADGGSGAPSTRVASEAGNAANSAYTYRSVTEFQITTSTAWLAVNFNSASTNLNYQSAGSVYYKTGQTYVTIASPFPSSPSTDTAEAQMKCGHT